MRLDETIPPSWKTVGSKWVFTKKTWADGTVEHYKARLVAQGFTQNVWYGLYDKTFCPVVRLESLHAYYLCNKISCYNKWM